MEAFYQAMRSSGETYLQISVTILSGDTFAFTTFTMPFQRRFCRESSPAAIWLASVVFSSIMRIDVVCRMYQYVQNFKGALWD